MAPIRDWVLQINIEVTELRPENIFGNMSTENNFYPLIAILYHFRYYLLKAFKHCTDLVIDTFSVQVLFYFAGSLDYVGPLFSLRSH